MRQSRLGLMRIGSRIIRREVIELLGKVCAVSVGTMEIVDGMAYWDDGYLIVFDDRDKHEWTMMGMARWFSEPTIRTMIRIIRSGCCRCRIFGTGGLRHGRRHRADILSVHRFEPSENSPGRSFWRMLGMQGRGIGYCVK